MEHYFSQSLWHKHTLPANCLTSASPNYGLRGILDRRGILPSCHRPSPIIAKYSETLPLISSGVAAISGVFGFYNESRFCMFSGFKASHYDVIKPGYSHLGCGMKFYTVPGALSFLYDNRTDTCNFTTTTSVQGILCDYYTLNLFAPYATVIPSELCNKTHGDDSPVSFLF